MTNRKNNTIDVRAGEGSHDSYNPRYKENKKKYERLVDNLDKLTFLEVPDKLINDVKNEPFEKVSKPKNTK